MSTFKVQRIRSCVQCGDMLSLKCKACTAHPNRKPRVIELYDWPEVLKTAECGCCIQIRCQATGCVKTRWCNTKWNTQGKQPSKRFFCSIPCSSRTISSDRCKKQTVPCAYCTKPVSKKSYEVKTWTKSFCNKTCYAIYRAKAKHDAKEAVRKALDGDGSEALLQCAGKCRGAITEHTATSKTTARCVPCGAVRDSRVLVS